MSSNQISSQVDCRTSRASRRQYAAQVPCLPNQSSTGSASIPRPHDPFRFIKRASCNQAKHHHRARRIPEELPTSQSTSYDYQHSRPGWLLSPARSGEGSQQTFGGQYVNSSLPIASHPSQERFGVEEATVSELVEFFENEKQCSVDPSGKPCDHCAMRSPRGF